jgi:hypothetical protein
MEADKMEQASLAKKKYLIKIIPITQLERHKVFEIKLPANVKKVSGVIITTSQS